jgi:hypothetical protein
MNGRSPLPSLDELKAQAKRLRSAMSSSGEDINHGRALELVARQHGYRDWNTMHAAVGNGPPGPPVNIGEHVSGRYLGQKFSGEVIGLSVLGDAGRYRVTLKFDEPVDVVTFDSFSNYRTRVNCVVGPDGVSPARTSNGQPHMVLSL